jgi:hypothetical protein
MVYRVDYDLVGVKNYEKLFDVLKGYDDCIKVPDSSWIIKSSESAAIIRDALKEEMDGDDQLLVMEIASSADWASRNLSQVVTNWIHKNI